MKDPEFVDLRNKFFTGVFVALLFAIPLFIFMYKTYISSDALTMINNNKSFVMLVVSNDCSNCKLVGDLLKDNDIKFVKVNKDTNKDYNTIMSRMGITNKKEEFPVVIYVEKGKMKANLFSISTEEKLLQFIEFHQLGDLAG